MKRWSYITVGFVAGLMVASVAWGWHLIRYQIEVAAISTTVLHGQAGAGEQILTYLDDPQPDGTRRLAFMASNMVARFPTAIDGLDQEYPYLHLNRRWSSERRHFEEFLSGRREARASTNSSTKSER